MSPHTNPATRVCLWLTLVSNLAKKLCIPGEININLKPNQLPNGHEGTSETQQRYNPSTH